MKIRFDEEFADRPYNPAAYEFVLQSLDRTIRICDPPRHVSGGEVLAGLRRDAHEQFGPMAAHVLEGGPDFRLLVKNAIDDQAWSTPAIADGALFLRTAKHLYCFSGTN